MNRDDATMTRSELARQCRVNAETLRFYEQQRLLPAPERSASNYRLYSPDHVRRVRFIQRAKELGFTLKEIRELMTLSAAAGDDCGDVRERASRKIDEIDDKLKALQGMRRTLLQLKQQCSGEGALDECPILKSFETEE